MVGGLMAGGIRAAPRAVPVLQRLGSAGKAVGSAFFSPFSL